MKKQSLAATFAQGLSGKLPFSESPVLNCLPLHWTGFLHCFCHLSQALHKCFLESYFNQNVGGFPYPIRAVPLSPIRKALFWPIRTVSFRPFRGFWILICMGMGQSGTKGRDLCPYKPAPPLAGRVYFPFQRRMKIVSPSWAETLTGCLAKWTRAEESRSFWSGANQCSRKYGTG